MADERIGYIVVRLDHIGDNVCHVADQLPSRLLHFDQADAEWERDNHVITAQEAGLPSRFAVCEVREASDG